MWHHAVGGPGAKAAASEAITLGPRPHRQKVVLSGSRSRVWGRTVRVEAEQGPASCLVELRPAAHGSRGSPDGFRGALEGFSGARCGRLGCRAGKARDLGERPQGATLGWGLGAPELTSVKSERRGGAQGGLGAVVWASGSQGGAGAPPRTSLAASG